MGLRSSTPPLLLSSTPPLITPLPPPRTLEPLPLGDQYWNIRDAMVQSELLLLRMCQFGVKFSHPHKYLLHYLKSLKDWMSPEVWAKYPVAKVSWSLLQDLYHDPRVLEPDPSLTAIACI